MLFSEPGTLLQGVVDVLIATDVAARGTLLRPFCYKREPASVTIVTSSHKTDSLARSIRGFALPRNPVR